MEKELAKPKPKSLDFYGQPGYSISIGGHNNFGFNPAVLPQMPGYGQMYQGVNPMTGWGPISYTPRNMTTGVSIINDYPATCEKIARFFPHSLSF